MAAETKDDSGSTRVQQDPFAHLVATSEERNRILAAGRPFDVEAWLRNAITATPAEVEDLEDFLLEREAMRRYNLERQEELVKQLGE